MKDNTEWPIPVTYKGKIIGYREKDGNIKVTNPEVWNKLLDSGPIGISSRAEGKVKEGRVIEKKQFEDNIIENIKKSTKK